MPGELCEGNDGPGQTRGSIREHMLEGKCTLAVVPARSGSKGIPDKNMRSLSGTSLIGLAGRCLDSLAWIDAKIISTDSVDYAREGMRYGLEAPFMRPSELSTDTAGAVETITHALREAENFCSKKFDIILIVEPTSPLRRPEDIESSVRLLLSSGADSVVTVNPLSSKFHPAKVLREHEGRIYFYETRGAAVVMRQSLDALYWRNGVCYALTRSCLVDQKRIITANTVPFIMEREVVNIDEPIELEWAEFLLKRQG